MATGRERTAKRHIRILVSVPLVLLLAASAQGYRGTVSVDRVTVSNENCGESAPIQVTARNDGAGGALCWWWDYGKSGWVKGTASCVPPSGGKRSFTATVPVPSTGDQTQNLIVECHDYADLKITGWTDTCKDASLFDDPSYSTERWGLPIQTSAHSYVGVASTPDSALIVLDGTSTGQTTKPGAIVSLEVTPGAHTVRLIKQNYKDYTKALTVSCGATAGQALVSATLVGVGTLTVSSEPSGASVYLGGVSRGTTPLVLKDLEEGTHSIRVARTGYQDFTDVVTLTPGGAVNVRADLKKVQICTPGARECSGSNIRACSADGTEWTVTETCSLGCERGACRTPSPATAAPAVAAPAAQQPAAPASPTPSKMTIEISNIPSNIPRPSPGFEVLPALAALGLLALVLRKR
ncbi:MAG: PEGA domain-containing protein [Halobacteria archaeon]